MHKQTIGRKEYISLPELGLYKLKCKIDTGAYTSSLHCKDIVIKGDGYVYCIPLDENYEAYEQTVVKFPLLRQKGVKSSNGLARLRAYIKTKALFFGKEYPIVLSLTDRTDMKYPILIGRKFLKNRFLVDVSDEFLEKKDKK